MSRSLLPDWWLSDFTEDEREAIERAFRPLGNITASAMVAQSNPFANGSLAVHLKTEDLRHLGYRLWEQADRMISHDMRVLDQHFYWAGRGEFYYRFRDADGFALEEATRSFQNQINLGPKAAAAFLASDLGAVPAHAGYRQMRIILEKQGDIAAAIAICRKAMAEGWADDWSKHIARLSSKLR